MESVMKSEEEVAYPGMELNNNATAVNHINLSDVADKDTDPLSMLLPGPASLEMIISNTGFMKVGSTTSDNELVMPDGKLKKFYCSACKRAGKKTELRLRQCPTTKCPLKMHTGKASQIELDYLEKNCDVFKENCFCKSFNEENYFDVIGRCESCKNDYHICPEPNCLNLISLSTILIDDSRDALKGYNDHLRTVHNKQSRIQRIGKIQSSSSSLLAGNENNNNNANGDEIQHKIDCILNPKIVKSSNPKAILDNKSEFVVYEKFDSSNLESLLEMRINSYASSDISKESKSLAIIKIQKKLLDKDADVEKLLGKISVIETELEVTHSELKISKEIKEFKKFLLINKDERGAIKCLEKIIQKIESVEEISHKKSRIMATIPVEFNGSIVPIEYQMTANQSAIVQAAKVDGVGRDVQEGCIIMFLRIDIEKLFQNLIESNEPIIPNQLPVSYIDQDGHVVICSLDVTDYQFIVPLDMESKSSLLSQGLITEENSEYDHETGLKWYSSSRITEISGDDNENWAFMHSNDLHSGDDEEKFKSMFELLKENIKSIDAMRYIFRYLLKITDANNKVELLKNRRLQLLSVGVDKMIMDAIVEHKDNTDIQKDGLQILRNLISSNEDVFEALKQGIDIMISDLIVKLQDDNDNKTINDENAIVLQNLKEIQDIMMKYEAENSIESKQVIEEFKHSVVAGFKKLSETLGKRLEESKPKNDPANAEELSEIHPKVEIIDNNDGRIITPTSDAKDESLSTAQINRMDQTYSLGASSTKMDEKRNAVADTDDSPSATSISSNKPDLFDDWMHLHPGYNESDYFQLDENKFIVKPYCLAPPPQPDKQSVQVITGVPRRDNVNTYDEDASYNYANVPIALLSIAIPYDKIMHFDYEDVIVHLIKSHEDIKSGYGKVEATTGPYPSFEERCIKIRQDDIQLKHAITSTSSSLSSVVALTLSQLPASAFEPILQPIIIDVLNPGDHNPDYILKTNKRRVNNKSIVHDNNGKPALSVRAIKRGTFIEIQYRIFTLSSENDKKKLGICVSVGDKRFHSFPIGVKAKTIYKDKQSIPTPVPYDDDDELKDLRDALNSGTKVDIINAFIELAKFHDCFDELAQTDIYGSIIDPSTTRKRERDDLTPEPATQHDDHEAQSALNESFVSAVAVKQNVQIFDNLSLSGDDMDNTLQPDKAIQFNLVLDDTSVRTGYQYRDDNGPLRVSNDPLRAAKKAKSSHHSKPKQA